MLIYCIWLLHVAILFEHTLESVSLSSSLLLLFVLPGSLLFLFPPLQGRWTISNQGGNKSGESRVRALSLISWTTPAGNRASLPFVSQHFCYSDSVSVFSYFCLLFEFGLEITTEHTQSNLVNPTDPGTTQPSYFLFIVNVINIFMDCQFSRCLFSGYKVLIKLDSL